MVYYFKTRSRSDRRYFIASICVDVDKKINKNNTQYQYAMIVARVSYT